MCWCVVKRMCESGTLKNTRVVIDSWGTGGPGTNSCSCTVTLDTGSAPTTATTTVVVEEYPRVAPLQNCGSILSINSTKSSSFTKTVCTSIPSISTINFGISDMLTLTLSRADVATSWISGHCILITLQGSASLELSVTCNEPQGKTDQSTNKTITTTTPTTIEYVQTTTVQPLTTTTTTESMEATSTQSREITTYNDTNTGQTTSGQEKCVQKSHPQGYPLIGVVVPIVVTLLVVAVATVANVILYKRRLTMVNELKHGMTSQDTVHYDSLDKSSVEPTNMYEEMSTQQTYVNTAMAT
ncbi:hypothetical protein KP79_PYT02862 [Mizuhopecten yessoensis]|uniref:Uncharacterized protein n=1 Tax=Mizuhopecten yessoensis TaxID=6573 RepID=A0A210PJW5_MIZYE|nr:hypothetical protein KP79_PYT02862 [Mizuhopecten yessoensis]